MLNALVQPAARCTNRRISARSSAPAVSSRASIGRAQVLLSYESTEWKRASRSVRVAAAEGDKSSAEAPSQPKGDLQESTVDSAAVLEEV